MQKVQSVIGLGFGDEGKGITTDYLCSKADNPLVIRFSGGQQAGHTVYLNDKKHVFSNFGSGTLRGVPTYWSKYCSFDPEGALNELKVLKEIGIEPILYIDCKCPITTQFEKFFNQKNNFAHGTVGVGVGPTFKREEEFYSLLAEDIFFPEVVKIKLKLFYSYYNSTGSLEEYSNYFLNLLEQIKNSFIVTKNMNMNFIKYDLIAEGSQGLLLDQHHGFFPHVTRSNTGTKNLIEMGLEPELFLVTRAYQTRHGNGPMSNIGLDLNLIKNKDETNVYNEYQGEFKKTVLDLSLLQYATYKDEYIRDNILNATLVITCIDQLNTRFPITLTLKNDIKYFDNKNAFVKFIKNQLNVKEVYISESHYADDIRKFEE